MKSYKKNVWPTNRVFRNTSKEGETLETKIERMVNNKEPIKNEAPLIYTERNEGVQPGYNIRTDRFEVAIDASTAIARSYKARREERQKAKMEINKEEDGKTEPTPGKAETGTNKAK